MRKLIFKLTQDNSTGKLLCNSTVAKQEFGLTVDSTADLTPNAKEWFNKALLQDGSRFTFRTIPNVKDSAKIGSLEFGNVLQAADCDFDNTGGTLSAKSMTVCALKVNTEICQIELEGSFISDWMRAGSNVADFSPATFMSHYLDRLAAAVADQLETATWQGVSGVCDGLEKQLSGATTGTSIVRLTATTITSSNVVAQMTRVYNAIPTKIKNRKKDLVWYVSANVADAYRLAVATASAEVYLLQDITLSFLGIKVLVGEGMSDNTMALSLADNFVFLTDLVGDVDDVTVVPMLNTTAEAKIRTVTQFKFGVNYTNGTEIVFYSSLNV